MTEETLEELGKLVDRLDNLNHALSMPMPDSLHVVAMREALPGLKADLKQVYLDLGGDDVWGIRS